MWRIRIRKPDDEAGLHATGQDIHLAQVAGADEELVWSRWRSNQIEVDRFPRFCCRSAFGRKEHSSSNELNMEENSTKTPQQPDDRSVTAKPGRKLYEEPERREMFRARCANFPGSP